MNRLANLTPVAGELEPGRKSSAILGASLLVVALLVAAALGGTVFRGERTVAVERDSLPPGDEIWASRPLDALETVIAGAELWQASPGVWHLERGVWVRNGTVLDHGFAMSPDGTIWLRTTAEVLEERLAETGVPGIIRKVMIELDGTVWACSEGRVLHFAQGVWTTIVMPVELGVVGCEMAVTADGALWVGTFNAWSPWTGGLARFDGSQWELAQPLGPGVDLPVVGLSTGPDGILWAVLVEFEESPAGARFDGWMMASFDGEQWTAYPRQSSRFPVSAVGTFDGATWFEPEQPTGSGTRTGAVSFDGEVWIRYNEGDPVEPSEVADGTVWLAGPTVLAR